MGQGCWCAGKGEDFCLHWIVIVARTQGCCVEMVQREGWENDYARVLREIVFDAT